MNLVGIFSYFSLKDKLIKATYTEGHLTSNRSSENFYKILNSCNTDINSSQKVYYNNSHSSIGFQDCAINIFKHRKKNNDQNL